MAIDEATSKQADSSNVITTAMFNLTLSTSTVKSDEDEKDIALRYVVLVSCYGGLVPFLPTFIVHSASSLKRYL